MKKRAALLVLFVLTLATSAYAHPPSDIKITFDPATKMLHADIIHDVKDTSTHFIKKVDVSLNGKEIIAQEFSLQGNNESQLVHYLIPDAKIGDTVSVEGYCNISGKLEKELKVR